MTFEQNPSVGRIVHFSGVVESKCEAAIVTNVHADRSTVDLTIFGSDGERRGKHIPFDATRRKVGSWHWPEREA